MPPMSDQLGAGQEEQPHLDLSNECSASIQKSSASGLTGATCVFSAELSLPVEEIQDARAVAQAVADGGTESEFERLMYIYGYTHEALGDIDKSEQERIDELSRKNPRSLKVYFAKASNSLAFRCLFGTVVLLNAVTVWISVESNDKQVSASMSMIEIIFTVLYVLEIGVRIFGHTRSVLRDTALLLDILVVFFCCVGSALFITGFNSDETMGLSVLIFLRLPRWFRILRVLRGFVRIRPMEVLGGNIGSACGVFVWLLALLTIFFFLFSLILRMLFEDLEGKLNGTEVNILVEQYFGSVFQSTRTCFEVLLIGFDWAEKISDPLFANDTTFFIAIFWFIFCLFVHVCLSSIIVGTFVEQLIVGAAETDKRRHKEALITNSGNIPVLKDLFRRMDVGGKGFVTLREFRDAADEINRILGDAISDAGATDALFHIMDISTRGAIDVDDFISCIIKLKGGPRSVDALLFDFQIRQIIKAASKAPQQLVELRRELSRIDKRMESVTTEMEATRNKHYSCDLGPRLQRLEEQMNFFLSALQLDPANSRMNDAGMAVGNTEPALTITNLKDSYMLAEEMRELRITMEAATQTVLRRRQHESGTAREAEDQPSNSVANTPPTVAAQPPLPTPHAAPQSPTFAADVKPRASSSQPKSAAPAAEAPPTVPLTEARPASRGPLAMLLKAVHAPNSSMDHSRVSSSGASSSSFAAAAAALGGGGGGGGDGGRVHHGSMLPLGTLRRSG